MLCIYRYTPSAGPDNSSMDEYVCCMKGFSFMRPLGIQNTRWNCPLWKSPHSFADRRFPSLSCPPTPISLPNNSICMPIPIAPSWPSNNGTHRNTYALTSLSSGNKCMASDFGISENTFRHLTYSPYSTFYRSIACAKMLLRGTMFGPVFGRYIEFKVRAFHQEMDVSLLL